MNRLFLFLGILLVFSEVSAQKKNFLFGGAQTDSKPSSNTINDIVVDKRGRIWLATGQGISCSDDKGKTWQNFSAADPFHGEVTYAIAVRGDTVVTGLVGRFTTSDNTVLPTGEGIVVSTDYGVTWTKYPQPVDVDTPTTIRYGKNNLKALPVTTNIQNIPLSFAIGDSGAIWMATFAGMLRRSTDLGKTFHVMVLPPDGFSSIDTNGSYGFDVSPTDNQKYGLTGNLNHIAFSVAEDSGTIWVGTDGGINRTTNEGVSWKKFNHINYGITGNRVFSIGVKSHGTIWASTFPSFKSFDSQDTTEFRGVSYTTNGGDDWMSVPALRNEIVNKIAFDNGGHVFAASESGAWCSPDNGATWTRPGTIVDYRSRQRIETNSVLSVASVSSSPNIVFIGTGDGLASSSFNDCLYDGTWTIYRAYETLSEKTKVYAYPTPMNPATDVARIHYSLEQSSAVTVKIYDFDMKIVRTLIREATRTGGPGVELDEIWDAIDNNGSVVPNATYFFSVAAGAEDPRWGKVVVLR